MGTTRNLCTISGSPCTVDVLTYLRRSETARCWCTLRLGGPPVHSPFNGGSASANCCTLSSTINVSPGGVFLNKAPGAPVGLVLSCTAAAPIWQVKTESLRIRTIYTFHRVLWFVERNQKNSSENVHELLAFFSACVYRWLAEHLGYRDFKSQTRYRKRFRVPCFS